MATSQTKACGNGEGGQVDSTIIPAGPKNVFCQNLGSQIGDENAAALTDTQQSDDKH